MASPAQNHAVPDWFDSFRRAYRQACGYALAYAGADGRILVGTAAPTDCTCRSLSDRARIEAAEQTLLWGETTINLCCEDGYAMWAVPVMNNNAVSGCLVVQGVELETGEETAPSRIQKAADTLLEWAIRDNRITASAVHLARQRADAEKARFYALEQSKNFASDDIRSLYLREEPGLFAAIKQGDKAEARGILNRILVSIYSLGGHRMDLLKSCVLELIVMMSRAAVEAGADPSALLGANYRSLTELAAIEDEEDLSGWVRRMLESLIEAIRENDSYPPSLLLAKATAFMREHLGENLRRDEVARFAGVSPGHLTTVMTERMGRSFSDLLGQMRVDRAKDLLRVTDLSLSAIAVECGFYDQSHLNKAFRKATNQSPGEYRKRQRAG